MNNVKDQIGYDVNGFPVFQGDLVWCNPSSYKELVKVKVKKITPKGFTCYTIKQYNSFNISTVIMALTDIHELDLSSKCEVRNTVLNSLSENYPELYV